MQTAQQTQQTWVEVCTIDDLQEYSGVCALLNDEQVAIFMVPSAHNTHLYAISNWDPVGQANVLYRGIIGSVASTPVVASPLHKQRYDLITGQCLDDDSVSIDVFTVRQEQGRVLIAV
ncbi:nitrite reductase small subunit NirD [Pseudoalteromonas sp. SSDWG2]|uniref:nitrite reductase small subunit NirD n=1 Tax=Pseudoalteromonas sp. SSDWG2 TaxID=3139391 RepID=UPI003BAB3B39